MRFAIVLVIVFGFGASLTRAADMPSHCVALAGQYPGVKLAALGGQPDFSAEEIRFHYIGHSTYLIETSGGLTAATDFTGFVGVGLVPDVVTMNRAHDSHYTDFPDPAIPHVLKGWGEGGKPASHYLDLDQMVVRNVTTDLRAGIDSRIKDANSIFVFEAAGLCIGHLGHLHHEPSDAHYALLGRMDVVMVPVDGGRTLDTATMVRVMKRLKARLVLPMHWFGDGTLQRFATAMQDEFDVVYGEGNSVTTSLRELPRRPTVHILRPRAISAP